MVDKLEQIKENMIATSKANRRAIKKAAPQAIIIMIISHGINDKIFGFEGCRTLDEEGSISNDLVDISRIVDLFSDENFPLMKNMPKIFFFTCCRNSN